MAAAPIDHWPPGADWLAEPKVDGWRALLWRLEHRVYLQSRPGKDLSRYFPEVVAEGLRLPEGTVVDGEIVASDGHRFDFAQLQRRVTGAGSHLPAGLVCFDLLQHARQGVVMGYPLTERRTLLEQVIARTGPALSLCPQTDAREDAEQWLTWGGGVEGLVLKAAGGTYRPGQRGWWKWRVRTAVDLVVGGYTGRAALPRTLLLGAFTASGRLVFRARTTTLSTTASQELAPLLALVAALKPAGNWPNPLPARWVNLTGQEPLAYTPVEPLLVVEVQADTAFEHHRYRHPVRLVRVRGDLLP